MANAGRHESWPSPPPAQFTMIDHKKKEYYGDHARDGAATAAMAAKMKELEPQMERSR